MGKTTKPLRIVWGGQSVTDAPPSFLAELEAQGHEVFSSPMPATDLILGPTCCRFLPGMEFLLDSVIKGARKLRYGKEKL